MTTLAEKGPNISTIEEMEPKSALPGGGSSIKRYPLVHSAILDERKRQRQASHKNYTRNTSEVELRLEALVRLQADKERGAVNLNDSLSFINKNLILDPHVAAEEQF
jgi:hypothetical protein